ncbi:glycerol-3-phosphate 1-O-acyltransferase PlsY [Taklimakanibacter albus]|jgi:glycerol-3-phosphate acyltransferase PlsY|uniref:Glycerol-3-phosphate 1-O-acyltransferase PlsY n=1 Tax=Taklimakanibacter albus TaxID=2800327 RepID=A0ACC5R1D9_9HYPH|nr:glycerol-3-phosphate 1-O-acyltransferase PlsY [Aestuariivirga sp. YIM B02566]MBK1866455.1 glycerol-3-phosphate 1-O-acyltransferase PlsY [Aestuariivirga sp. YIM B02566]
MLDFAAVTPAMAIMAALLGYLSGSIPFGLLFTRWAGLGDVRSIGSGNIGATNVLRTGNKKIAAATLIADAVKGTIPILLMKMVGGESAGLIAGLAAFAGHLFPIWLGFKGGKGVATNIGILFGLYWPLGLIFLAVWLAMAVIFRISSLSALTAAALSPLWAWLLGRPTYVLPLILLAALIWIMHHENIARLLKGQESRIKLGSKS